MRDNRVAILPGLALAATLSVAPVTSASACDDCAADGPVIVYGHAPYPVVLPPVGYVLDPSDARPPIYVVNAGPVYSGPGIYTYAVPTYSEGGYAYGFPYVYGYYSSWRPKAAYYPRAPIFRGTAYRYPYSLNPKGFPFHRHPAGAYRYRTAPTARVLRARENAAPSRPAQPTPRRSDPLPPPAREETPPPK